MNLLRTIIAVLFPVNLERARANDERKAHQFSVAVHCLRQDIDHIESVDHLFAYEEEIRVLFNTFKGQVKGDWLIEATDELESQLKAKATALGASHLLDIIAV
jgi:hypothetical protein